jgi:hypothetical protein
MKKQFVALISCSLLILSLTGTFAGAEDIPDTPIAPQLQMLKHTVLSPANEQVVLQFNGSYSPKISTLKGENPRLIFDFEKVTYTRAIKSVTTTDGSIVKRVRVGRHESDPLKTRVVFDVATLNGLDYTQEFDEQTSSLVVRFTVPDNATMPQPKGGPAAVTPAQETTTASNTPDKMPTAAPNQKEQAKQPATAVTAAATTKRTKPEEAKQSSPASDASVVEPPAKPGGKTSPPSNETAVEPKKPAKEVAKQPASDSGKEEKTTVTKSEEKASTPPNETAAEPKKPAKEDVKQPTPDSGKKEKATVAKPGEKASTPANETAAEPKKPAKEDVKQPAPDSGKEEKATVAKSGEKTSGPANETAAEPKKPAKEDVKQPAPDSGKEEKATVAAKTDKPAETNTPAIITQSTGKPQLESVKFDGSSSKGEMIMFKLNGFHPPAIHGVEEGIPRVICDFTNTKLLQPVKGPIKTNGQFVKMIRLTTIKKPEKIRVVIDLEPNHSYDLQQVFFKEDNLFVLFVNETKK